VSELCEQADTEGEKRSATDRLNYSLWPFELPLDCMVLGHLFFLTKEQAVFSQLFAYWRDTFLPCSCHEHHNISDGALADIFLHLRDNAEVYSSPSRNKSDSWRICKRMNITIAPLVPQQTWETRPWLSNGLCSNYCDSSNNCIRDNSIVLHSVIKQLQSASSVKYEFWPIGNNTSLLFVINKDWC